MADSDDRPADDLELVERWRGGDRRAGHVLVSRHFNAVRAYFLNAVGDRDREDLVQETFRRLTGSVGRFEGRSSFKTFLYTIAHRTLLDHLRRRYRGKDEFEPLTHSVEDLEGVRPSHVVTALERHQKLLACIRALPVETKQLLELYYWQDLSAAEVGEVFGVPETTIRNRLHAARQRLIRCMQAEAEPELEPKAVPEAEPEDPDEPGPGPLDRTIEDQLRELGRFFASGVV